jgi:hypothetical protein
MGEMRNAYRIFMGKPEGKRPLGRPRCRWVANIKIDLKRGWDGMDSALLVSSNFIKMVNCNQVP